MGINFGTNGLSADEVNNDIVEKAAACCTGCNLCKREVEEQMVKKSKRKKMEKVQQFTVYTNVMNPHGRDYVEAFGSADTLEELYPIIKSIRDQFNDTFEELDANVWIGDDDGLRFDNDITPSDIIKKYGSPEDMTKDELINRCNDCFYYVDVNGNKCERIGEECSGFISVDDYWGLVWNDKDWKDIKNENGND